MRKKSQLDRDPKKEMTALSIVKGLGFFVLYFGLQLAVSIAFELVITVKYMLRGEGSSAEDIVEQVVRAVNSSAMQITIAFDLLFLAVAALIMLSAKRPFAVEDNRSLFRRPSAKKLLLAFFIGAAANFALNVIFVYAQMLLPEWIFQNYADVTEGYTAGGILPYIIAGVILAPIVEELVFRGFMITRFRRGMPTAVAVIVVGLIFGVIHGNLVQAVYAGLLGILLGAIFVHGGSLYLSIAAHFGFNLMSLPGYFASLEGSTLGNSQAFNAIYMLLSYLAPLLLVPLCGSYFDIIKKEKNR